MCSAVCEHALFAGRLQLGSQGCRVALRRLVLSRLGVCARTRPSPPARSPALPVSRGAARARLRRG